MSIQIVPLGSEHLEQAAALVAARYRAQRQVLPFLPDRFEDPAAILPRLREHVGNVPSVAALREGRLAGFVLTFLVNNRGGRLAVVPDFGHAALAEDRCAVYRQMYAAIADQWLANGCFWHAISLYPHERAAIDAWFSVGFGLAVIDALQPLDRAWNPAQLPDGIRFRRGGRADIDVVTPLELGLDRHLSASPAYLPFLV